MTKDIKQLIIEVLEKGYLMSLGTHDKNGVWVCDLVYVYDDDINIFWMSFPDARHSNAIKLNPQVAAVITANTANEPDMSIQLSGIATRLEGSRHDLTLVYNARRGRPAPKEDEDVLGGRSWYMLKPKKIDLIHQQLFGFEKKFLELW